MARRVERQARLMGELLERLSIDPGAAAQDGRGISLAAASRRCLVCRNSEACRSWLDRGGGDAAPAFCPNAAYFNHSRASVPAGSIGAGGREREA